jgi:YD repeat-containing protein
MWSVRGGFAAIWLTGVSDFASRSASLTYNTTHGHLATIVGVDPDSGGPLSAGTTTFTTNTTTHKVTNREDAISNDTGFTYSASNGTLTTITHPDTETTQLVALQTRGLPTGTTGNALTGLSVFATVTNERSHSTNYSLDRFGNVIEAIDPLYNATTIERNHLGQPVRITGADPDGSGTAYTSSVIVMGYSAGDNNLVFQKNPDDSTKSWTYTTFNLPATATDTLSRTEEYGYDAYGNMTSFEDAGEGSTVPFIFHRGFRSGPREGLRGVFPSFLDRGD